MVPKSPPRTWSGAGTFFQERSCCTSNLKHFPFTVTRHARPRIKSGSGSCAGHPAQRRTAVPMKRDGRDKPGHDKHVCRSTWETLQGRMTGEAKSSGSREERAYGFDAHLIRKLKLMLTRRVSERFGPTP